MQHRRDVVIEKLFQQHVSFMRNTWEIIRRLRNISTMCRGCGKARSTCLSVQVVRVGSTRISWDYLSEAGRSCLQKWKKARKGLWEGWWKIFERCHERLFSFLSAISRRLGLISGILWCLRRHSFCTLAQLQFSLSASYSRKFFRQEGGSR